MSFQNPSETVTNQIRWLSEVSHLISSNSRLTETLVHILKGIVEVVEADSARIIADHEVYAVGLQSETIAATDSLVHHYCQKYGQLSIVEISKAPDGFDFTKLNGLLSSIMLYPLQSRTLWLGFRHIPQLADYQREFLDLMVLQAVIAIQFAEMRTGREQLNALLTNDFEPIVIVDEQYHIQVFNPAAESVFHVNATEAIGQLFETVIKSDSLRQMIQDGIEARNDVEFDSGDGKTFSPHVSAVKSADGTLRGWLLVLRDVTRFKRLSENMSDFLHTVSHDIRSPMTAAKGFVDMLTMVGDVNEKQEHFITKIGTSINDMTNLVEKVLDAGRLDPEMDVYEIRRETCDPAAVVEKVVSNLTSAAQRKQIELNSDIAHGLPIMNIDEMMIERALTNLVENAIKYTPDSGQVVVKTFVRDNYLVFAVQDNGYGIAPEDQSRLFERGERIRRKEHKAIRGSGLGLFIVRNVARKHNGKAVVESEEGKGSTFSILIPLEGKNLVGGG